LQQGIQPFPAEDRFFPVHSRPETRRARPRASYLFRLLSPGIPIAIKFVMGTVFRREDRQIMLKADKVLDIQGVADAATRLRVTEQIVRDMKPGQFLKIVISGPGAKQSVAELCRRLGCQVIAPDEEPDSVMIAVRGAPCTFPDTA
jgi:TusA-related sulfurtransferase